MGAASQIAAPAIADVERTLERDLASGTPELPSFPEVALRVSRALGDDDIEIDSIVRLVSAEPSLAVRLLQLANSAALNASAKHVISLRAAIARVGFNTARTATIAFALSQMQRATAWEGLAGRLRVLWEESAGIGALAYVIARRWTKLDADQALLAGMLHAMGKLFVLTRAAAVPGLIDDAERYAPLEAAWHRRAAHALLARWDLAAATIAAAADFTEAHVARDGPADLSDVLFAAHQLSKLEVPDGLKSTDAFGSAPFRRLGLDAAACAEALVQSTDNLSSLRAALVD